MSEISNWLIISMRAPHSVSPDALFVAPHNYMRSMAWI
jgi:hypothetical protein